MNIKQMPRIQVNQAAQQLQQELQNVSQQRDQLLRLMIGTILRYRGEDEKLGLVAAEVAHLDLRRLVVDIEQLTDGTIRLSVRDQLAPAAPPALEQVAILPAVLPSLVEEPEEIEPLCECTHEHNGHVARVGGCKYCPCTGYRAKA